MPSGASTSATVLEVVAVLHPDLDDVAAGAGLQLGRRAGGDRPAVVDDDHVVGQLVGLLEVLRGQQHVGASGHQRSNRFPQIDAGAWIQTGRRLVQQQQAGRTDQAGAEVELAAHAARVALHRPVGVLGQVDLAQHHVGGSASGMSAVTEQATDHHEVLAPGQRRLDGSVLAGQADDPANELGSRVGIDARDVQRPTVGLQQRGHRLDECGLAGAVRSEDGGHLAGRGDQVETCQGVHVAIALGQADGFDRGR